MGNSRANHTNHALWRCKKGTPRKANMRGEILRPPVMPTHNETMTSDWPNLAHPELHDELHARPPLQVAAPGVLSHWVQHGMSAACAAQALAAVCQHFGAPAPAPGASHMLLQQGTQAFKYERHGEFVSWQWFHALADAPADAAALRSLWQRSPGLRSLPGVLRDIFAQATAGELLTATQIVLLPAAAAPALPATPETWQAAFHDGELVGSHIGEGAATVLTDLRLHEQHTTRYLLLDAALSPGQIAREAQRLCEIEAYRMLAMLGFPLAQREAAALGALEGRLRNAVDAMAAGSPGDDTPVFNTLTQLAAEVEHIAARTRFRFAATRAYHHLVQRRLTALRETRLRGVQTLTGFLNRRLGPAVALCNSTDVRLSDVAERINRAVGLARVRVEVHREANNQELLKSLAQRAQMQLRLQQTVEGLSVVAITYYLLGLISYAAKAMLVLPALQDLHWKSDVLVGVAALPVLLAVWGFIRRLRRHLST